MAETEAMVSGGKFCCVEYNIIVCRWTISKIAFLTAFVIGSVVSVSKS